MSAKSLDSQIIASAVLGSVEGALSNLPGIIPTDSPKTKELEIEEYEGCMKATGVEKFESSSYLSVINYYLSNSDLEHHKPKGTLILYLGSENAGKFYKALGFKVPEDEDDASMLEACGKFCNSLGESFKNKLKESGYGGLVMSIPENYKNSVMGGAEFSAEQATIQEFSFFYWRNKAIVVEVVFADIPRRA